MTNAADVLDRLRALPFGSIDTLTGGEPFLVLAPHPDDETLGCGGLLAGAARRGQRGHVRIVTDGTGSHPDMAPERLKDIREAETRAALRALGVADDAVGFIGATDGAMPRAGARFDRIVDALVRDVDRLGIRTVFATWTAEPHADHRAVARLGQIVADRTRARLFYYPVWAWTLTRRSWLPKTALVGFRLDITDDLDRKRRAIACHVSQMAGDDAGGFTMAEEMRAQFERPVETFIAR